mmetsp:Transcript_3777/g.7694  ORF Transcript_3777/g.7694 Transcript_3777/m.7694 type:complete len:393 (+) Transcript_3777:720-1898(+)
MDQVLLLSKSDKRPTTTVTLLCSGLSTAAFLADSDHEFRKRMQVLVICERDEHLRVMLRRRFGRRISFYKDLRDLFVYLSNSSPDELLKFRTDILEITPPCLGRSKLSTGRGSYSQRDNDLFDLTCDIVKLLQPLVLLAEMTPPHKESYRGHLDLAVAIRTRLGYTVNVVDRFPTYLCGDYQARERWILLGRRYNVEHLDILTVCTQFAQPIYNVLDRLEDIKPSQWIDEPWTQVYIDTVYISNPVSFAEYPRTGSIRATVYELEQLNIYCMRLHSMVNHEVGTLVSLPTTRHFLGLLPNSLKPDPCMNSPLHVKVFTLLHNLFARCSSNYCGPLSFQIQITESESMTRRYRVAVVKVERYMSLTLRRHLVGLCNSLVRLAPTSSTIISHYR